MIEGDKGEAALAIAKLKAENADLAAKPTAPGRKPPAAQA